MKLLTLMAKWRLAQFNEHLKMLEDQEISAQYGQRVYREKRDRLAAQIAALESARTILGRLA